LLPGAARSSARRQKSPCPVSSQYEICPPALSKPALP
jgi:hypothetical protein